MSFENKEIYTFDWKTREAKPEKIKRMLENRKRDFTETRTGDLILENGGLYILIDNIPDNQHSSIVAINFREISSILVDLKRKDSSPVENFRKVEAVPFWTLRNYLVIEQKGVIG